MVRLSRIYTRTGDDGATGLGDGSRASKRSLRVCAYGEVDEANAALGWALLACPASGPLAGVASALRGAQHDLFDVGADLCVPIPPNPPGEAPGARLRVQPGQASRLEGLIDRFNEGLPALDSFVLPGGTELAARLHVARTVARRAERAVAALLEAEPATTSPHTLVYLNRLSDLLFVLGRLANAKAHGGPGDVLWKPGANRSD